MLIRFIRCLRRVRCSARIGIISGFVSANGTFTCFVEFVCFFLHSYRTASFDGTLFPMYIRIGLPLGILVTGSGNDQTVYVRDLLGSLCVTEQFSAAVADVVLLLTGVRTRGLHLGNLSQGMFVLLGGGDDVGTIRTGLRALFRCRRTGSMLHNTVVIAANGALMCMALSIGIFPGSTPRMVAGLAVFGAAYGTFCLVLAVCCAAGVSLDGVVLTADGTLECVALGIGVLRRFAPLMLHHFAVFCLTLGTFRQLAALCRAAAVRDHCILNAADLTFVGVAGGIFVVPVSTELMLCKFAVILAAVFANCAIVTGSLAAGVLQFFGHAPGENVGDFLRTLGILKILAAFGTEVIRFFARFLTACLDLLHLQRGVLVFCYLGECVVKRNLLVIAGAYLGIGAIDSC